jgi:hypothetical protein
MEKVWLSAFLTPTTRTPSPSTHSQNDQQSNPVWRIRDFYPGSVYFHPGSRIRIKKLVSKL